MVHFDKTVLVFNQTGKFMVEQLSLGQRMRWYLLSWQRHTAALDVNTLKENNAHDVVYREGERGMKGGEPMNSYTDLPFFTRAKPKDAAGEKTGGRWKIHKSNAKRNTGKLMMKADSGS